MKKNILNGNYEKIYKIITDGFLESVIKKGYKSDNYDDVFSYVDIVDFDEFDLTAEEEEFLVDCLREYGIVVYDRHGNVYGNYNGFDVYSKHTLLNDDFLMSPAQKIANYRKTNDRTYVDKMLSEDFFWVKDVAKQLSKKYSLRYDLLEFTAYECLDNLVEKESLEKIEASYADIRHTILLYVINVLVKTYKKNGKTSKLIEAYLDEVNKISSENLSETEIEEIAITSLAEKERVFVMYNSNNLNNRVTNDPMNLDEALNLLSEREQKVMKLRLGLIGKGASLEEVAILLGRTPEYVKKIENGAVNKLKNMRLDDDSLVNLNSFIDENLPKTNKKQR